MFEHFPPQGISVDWNAVTEAGIALVVAIAVAWLVHRTLFAVFDRIARMSETTLDEMVFAKIRRPVLWSLVAIAVAMVAQADNHVLAVWHRAAPFVVPALVGWVALSIVRALATALENRTELSSDPVAARSRKTRIAILSRTAIFAIVLITVALMLLAIPGVRDVGVTLMASAGLAALAIGAAAQPALKSLIAGLQMAVTEPLRIGDLVKVDGHVGRVEEIRMSYVVVRTWDERAIVVPTGQFLDESFENWSRKSERLTGPVFLHLDPATEIEAIRTEFERFVKTQELWDGRKAQMQVTEAYPESVELRLAVSSATIADLWELRCIVREHMLAWLRKEMPDALIRHRLEVEAANQRVQARE